MHEDRVVFAAATERDRNEFDCPQDARAFTERYHFDVRQIIVAFPQAHDGNPIGLFRKLLDPCMKKTQDRIIPVYRLRADEKPHGAILPLGSIPCLARLRDARFAVVGFEQWDVLEVL
jgi:hypothetical protein